MPPAFNQKERIMKTLVLFSSANKQGNTAKLIAEIARIHPLEIIDIDNLYITPYNYENTYPVDDFYPLVDKILAADKLVFASPVYWHATTAPMKALIDRITELTDVPHLKPKARALANKQTYVVSTSASEELCDVFDGFFSRVFNYFNMNYISKLHVNCRESFKLDELALNTFSQALIKGC